MLCSDLYIVYWGGLLNSWSRHNWWHFIAGWELLLVLFLQVHWNFIISQQQQKAGTTFWIRSKLIWELQEPSSVKTNTPSPVPLLGFQKTAGFIVKHVLYVLYSCSTLYSQIWILWFDFNTIVSNYGEVSKSIQSMPYATFQPIIVIMKLWMGFLIVFDW